MKYMKAASALAVSMMAAAAASPAVAADHHAMSLNKGVQQTTGALNTHPVDSTVQPLVYTATGAAQAVKEAKSGDTEKLLGTAGDAAKAAGPVLGGMPLGS